MRICSLLPSATEIAFALGLGDRLVGVSHSCDYPEAARRLPVLTRSLRGEVPGGALPVYAASEQGVSARPVFALDGELLRELRPDLILTQDICDVCAIGSNTVLEVAARSLGYVPEFLTVRAARLADIVDNMLAIGRAAGAGERAADLARSLQVRIDTVHARLAGLPRRRVGCLEWLAPMRVAGLWTAESAELAGAEPGLVAAGDRSRPVEWDELVDYAPEVVLVMPCGYDQERSVEELTPIVERPGWRALPAVANGEVYVFDGRVPSRHGPRAVDVLEAMAEIVQPDGWLSRRWRGLLYERM